MCPRISADDQTDQVEQIAWDSPDEEGAGKRSLAAVEQVAPLLADGALRGLRVSALHGRMTPEDKDADDAGFRRR